MKKIIVYYLFALLSCFVFGLICSLISFYSWWYVFLLAFPISLGWLPFSLIMESISPNQIEEVGCLILTIFILLIVLLILGAVFVDGNSFWGQTYAITILSAIISTLALIFKIRNKCGIILRLNLKI